MTNLMLIACGLAVQIFVFFALGSAFLKRIRKKECSAVLAVISGYLLYFTVFELVALPMVLSLKPLSLLAKVWGILVLISAAGATVWCFSDWIRQLKKISSIVREHKIFLLLLMACIGIQCLIGMVYSDNSADAAYYVGTASTAVYTDTMGRYNPYTGAAISHFSARYIFSCYPMHNAVVCSLTGIHPLIQTKTIMTAINIFLSNLVVYEIGLKLFKNHKIKADVMAAFVCLIHLFSNTIYTDGTFLLTRSYEGKSILANIIFPMVFYCAVRLYQDQTDRMVWILTFFTGVSAITFTGSSIILPVALTAGFLPVIAVKKKWKLCMPFLITMTPSILYIAVYFLCRAQIIILNA